jgi:alkaline phosphatase D
MHVIQRIFKLRTAAYILAIGCVTYLSGVSGYSQKPDLFPQGAAVGEVTASSAVFWTRTITPDDVKLEISTDPTFKGRVTFQQTVVPSSSLDFTLKIAVAGLTPSTTYFYQWRRGNRQSDLGTFRTAPLQSAGANVRFAFTGDSDGTRVNGVPGINNFEVLDKVRAEDPDFFVYLGDTIYADSDLRAAPATTLAEYRETYRLNREIAALPNLLKSTSTYATWDDHEVTNDYDGKTVDLTLYRNARQAFFEYMPLFDSGFPVDSQCAGDPLFRVIHWGKDVDVIILDTRSCRSADVQPLCLLPFGIPDPVPTLPSALRTAIATQLNLPGVLPPQADPGCLSAIFDPTRTMLGAQQKAQFFNALRTSTAKFKFVINQLPIQQFYTLPYDRWEGYGAERNEVLNFIRNNSIANVIFLTTDTHANLVNEVFIDRFVDGGTIAQEFVTGPIAEGTLEGDTVAAGGPLALVGLHAILDVVGVDCRELNAFSYGSVEVNSAAGTATIVLKDEDGNAISDRRLLPLPSPSLCAKTFQ